MKKILLYLLLSTHSLQAFSDNLSDSNKLFDWAEKNYSQYFNPPKGGTFKVESYWVRYYKSTDVYIGTLGEEVYILGDIFNGLKHVGRISDFIDLSDNKTITDHHLKIVGSDAFVIQTKAALELLKNQSPRAFKKVQQYISIFEQAKYSHMWSDEVPPRYAVDEMASFKSVKWYAGTMAHEATHSELYQAYKAKNGLPVPDDIWRSADAETYCIEYQIDVMKEINAAKYDIQFLNDELNGNNCDIDGSC